MLPTDPFLLAVGAWLVTGGYIALAAMSTVHVLRHKREVGAAAAWIGVSWLSPFFGAALYFVFGINRVKRRARKLRGRRPVAPPRATRRTKPIPDHLQALERAAGRLTDRPMLAGNRVELLRNGDEAYPPMIAAIDAARASVALASYIFRDDPVGRQFIDALARAHRRGVAVRVLIDGVGSGYLFGRAWQRLIAAGVPAARFMHTRVPWRMPFLNLRNHKKILCVDGRVGFTGGINIGQENMRDFDPRHAVRDTHFRFDGPVVAQFVETFAEDWWFTTEEELEGEAWFPENLPAVGEVAARAVISGPDDDYEKIEFVVLHAIACAQKSILILTPYFLPHDGLITALELAGMRGVQVDIVLPSNTDLPLVDWARRAQIKPLVAAQNCQVFLTPPPFEHSKLMVVDEAWALVGSANWDARSFRLNFELNVEVRDVELIRTIADLIKRKRGPELTGDQFDHYPFIKELRDNAVRLLLPYL
jgi:cardiolipin synthase